MEIEKQILRYGKWKHPEAPNGYLEVTDEMLDQIIENHEDNPSPVIKSHAWLEEVERNPDLLISKDVKRLEKRDDGLYAVFELDDEAVLEEYNDVSASVYPFYEDHETGQDKGAMLEHIALVLNPYIKKLKPFTKLGEVLKFNILLSETMKTKKKVDNSDDQKKEDAVNEEVQSGDVNIEGEGDQDVEGAKDTEKNTDIDKGEGEKDLEDRADGEEKDNDRIDNSESMRKRIELLEKRNQKMELELSEKKANEKFNELLEKGKVVPAQKDAYLALSVNSGDNTIKLGETKMNLAEAVYNLLDQGKDKISFGEKGVNSETGNDLDAVNLSDSQIEVIQKRKGFATKAETLEYVEQNKEVYSKYTQ